MRFTLVAIAAAAVTLIASAPALAENHDAKFPMPAAAFKEKVDARMIKARARMEERAAKLPAEQAKELRAKFDAGVAKVSQEVAKATADGTVTKDEARQVRATAKELRAGHGKHGKHPRKK